MLTEQRSDSQTMQNTGIINAKASAYDANAMHNQSKMKLPKRVFLLLLFFFDVALWLLLWLLLYLLPRQTNVFRGISSVKPLR